MALYFYQAFSKDGKKVTGHLDAPSIANVREQLSKQGMFPITISLEQAGAQASWWRRLFSRRVSTKDKILFTKQLTVLLKSGVPLLQALELLVEHFEGNLGSILAAIKDDIKEGSSLAKALKKYPRVFDNIYVQLVRAGEASGKLEVILERLTAYMERREEISRRLWDAMRGPLIQMAFAVIVVAVLLTVAVPMMAENFATFGQELPWATQFLMDISNAVLGHYILILIVIGAITSAFLYWKSTPSGARRWDELMLRIPIIKYFARMNAVVQFSHTLGMLIESGVNLAESLDIVCNIVDNRVLADALNEARDKIIKQGKIAQYLKQTNLFPPIAIYLIKTGEESGRLDYMLLTVAQTYEIELAELAESYAARLGPAMLLIMAVIVGFIVIAMMLPIAQMGEMVSA